MFDTKKEFETPLSVSKTIQEWSLSQKHQA